MGVAGFDGVSVFDVSGCKAEGGNERYGLSALRHD